MAELKYLVIHCTATPQRRKVTGNDIRAWHTNPVSKGGRGWKQVGYTDMFHLDGTVERSPEQRGRTGGSVGDYQWSKRVQFHFPAHCVRWRCGR